LPATDHFKTHLRAAFEAMTVGRSFTFSRTFTEGYVTVFCCISGDYNPYNLDDTFAAESWYGKRTIPGLLTASMGTHIGGMIGFIATEMDFRFLAPVYIGDTITCTVEVIERDEENRPVNSRGTWTNQSGDEVLTDRIAGFPSHMRLAPDGTPGGP
jgi:3-hydroxybutyryl-CoA dehydratase